MTADPLWQLDAVSLEPARLRDVSLVIARGVTAVLGAPGAGKSSLLNLLAKFEKANRGRITGAPRVAWAPANDGLWPHCTVREHLTIVGASPDSATHLLGAFDLAEKRDALPQALSRDGQARLAVARALASDAEVFILDEPLAPADPARLGGYWRTIQERLSATGASLIFSTPTPEIAIGEAHHAVCLRGGRLRYAGPIVSLYDEPPDEELMQCLGPGNWLIPTEARRWLRLQIIKPLCLRPEELVVTLSSGGPLRVEATRYRGASAEVELRHVPSNAIRTFYHRPPRDELRAGHFVQLSTVLGLLLAFLLVASELPTG